MACSSRAIPCPTATTPNYGWPNKGYYQLPDNKRYVVNHQGHRLRELTEMHRARTLDDNPKEPSSLFGDGRDELAAFYETPLDSKPDSGGIRFVFQYITICTQNSYDSLHNVHSLLRLRALADSLLPRCRARSGQSRQGLWNPKPKVFLSMKVNSTALQRLAASTPCFKKEEDSCSGQQMLFSPTMGQASQGALYRPPYGITSPDTHLATRLLAPPLCPSHGLEQSFPSFSPRHDDFWHPAGHTRMRYST